jgi:hypothetical protein
MSTTFDCHLKSMESWVGMKNQVYSFEADTMHLLFSRNLQKMSAACVSVTLSQHATHYGLTFLIIR